MYAVIKAGGKQHRVVEGETLKVEKIEVATGETIQFDDVLMVSSGGNSSDRNVAIGSPFVEGAAVKAEVIQHGRADKVRIIKFRRRKHSMKRQGHRQWFTEIKITDILASGADKVLPVEKASVSDSSADDLTKISGVGTVLVEKLAQFGVTRFAQIAAWTEDDIIAFDDKLNFKGRIERDDWIAQAKALMNEEAGN